MSDFDLEPQLIRIDEEKVRRKVAEDASLYLDVQDPENQNLTLIIARSRYDHTSGIFTVCPKLFKASSIKFPSDQYTSFYGTPPEGYDANEMWEAGIRLGGLAISCHYHPDGIPDLLDYPLDEPVDDEPVNKARTSSNPIVHGAEGFIANKEAIDSLLGLFKSTPYDLSSRSRQNTIEGKAPAELLPLKLGAGYVIYLASLAEHQTTAAREVYCPEEYGQALVSEVEEFLKSF